MHECQSCKKAEVWFETDGSQVFMNLNRVATEDDLENDHLLEYEGQTVEAIRLEVVFCPYCGNKIGSTDGVVPGFQHFNFGRKK
jgi:hypothetical protein